VAVDDDRTTALERNQQAGGAGLIDVVSVNRTGGVS
jgi:hypothetical protein